METTEKVCLTDGISGEKTFETWLDHQNSDDGRLQEKYGYPRVGLVGTVSMDLEVIWVMLH